VGAAAGVAQRAAALESELRARIERVRARTSLAERRPRVACLEWISPTLGPGHWLPELVELAGGRPGLGVAHCDSRRVAWEDVIAFAPEVIIVTPCGFDLRRTVAEADQVFRAVTAGPRCRRCARGAFMPWMATPTSAALARGSWIAWSCWQS